MPAAADTDTKTLLLDAAEQAFANEGFAASSLRGIIAAAGVNLAAVHYHYGSKDALIEAVFRRRIAPLNEERLRRLDEIEAAAGRRPPPLEQVVEALVGPALRLANDPARGGAVCMRLFGRTIAEPSEQLRRMFTEQFAVVLQRFLRALHRALPELPEPVLLWRFHFIIGCMAHTMTDPANLKAISGGRCDPRDTEAAVQQLVAFACAGLRAPVPRP
jgi:AcrR family transcriptional regulator